MRYPDSYKCDTMYINKFEKNFKKTMRYRFVNVFPKAMSAVPVAYGLLIFLRSMFLFNFDRLYSKQLETPINNFTELIIHYAFTKS